MNLSSVVLQNFSSLPNILKTEPKYQNEIVAHLELFQNLALRGAEVHFNKLPGDVQAARN